MATDHVVSLSESLDPPAVPIAKGEREYRAFQRLVPQLLRSYSGKFVAIHGEQVVDSDTDDVALVLRVHARIGYVPIHVGLVTEESLAPVRVSHYRLGRDVLNSHRLLLDGPHLSLEIE